MVDEDEEKGNMLNDFFSSVFTQENPMADKMISDKNSPLNVTCLTQQEVRRRLNITKIDKSPGPDGLHPRVLQELSTVIDRPLFLISKDSIITGSVPQDWRIANVVPIFKKGTKTELGNYRPVSLTSTVGKILEGILRDAILEYLKRNNLMTQDQHGFTRDRSCQTNLISFYKEVPVSKCTEDCPPGYRRILMNGSHKCCFQCLQCSDGEISNETDKRSCIRCPRDQWPNDNNQCAPKEREFLSYTDDSITLIITLIVIFLFLKTSFILGIFTLFRDTPVVKASNQSLSFLLLVSIMLSFLCIFLFLGRPTRLTCMLRQTLFGIIFSVAISSILAKTIMVYSAFKATKPGSKCRKFIGVKITNCLVFVCSFIQVVLCIIWLSTAPPFPESNFDLYVDKIVLQCNEGSIVAFSIILGYIGVLAAVSFLVAFLARNLPDSFNEAKYITFSMLVVCSVWGAFIPAYLSVTGKSSVLVEIFAILSSSVGILACIFYPKCYIIILRPDLNSKDNLLKKPKYDRENLTT
ncbi:unnamed protein product [Ranitomeya imitator]|uniref:G-protein coupled receptors family 3 profile domain-containing protein n=1 Tax=Ranitomeya imitator TaxID=111125 RepID=A0ABN9LHQ6_9NEOB|nr:unnamed protein product [Ranitomeya imitator]